MLGVNMDALRGRSLGVALVAIVVAAFGVVAIVNGLYDVMRSLVVGITESPRAGGAGLTDALGGLLIGAAFVVAGLGLWALRPWAWWLAVSACVVGFVLTFGTIELMVLAAALLAYLVYTREAFGSLTAPFAEIRARTA